MARQREIKAAQGRIERRIRGISSNPIFGECVKRLRNELNMTPEIARACARDYARGCREYLASPEVQSRKPLWEDAAASGNWRPFKIDKHISDEQAYRALAFGEWWNRRSEYDIQPVKDAWAELELNGVKVPFDMLVKAIWYDFEGTEFEDYVKSMLTALPFYWYSALAINEPFDQWLQNRGIPMLRPNRIYIDVTDATSDDVLVRWSEIEEIQRRLNKELPAPGVPPGTESKKGVVTCALAGNPKRRYSADELVEFLMEYSPDDRALLTKIALDAYQQEYYPKYLVKVKRKHNQPNLESLTPALERKAKRAAARNFHEQVELRLNLPDSVTGIATKPPKTANRRKLRAMQFGRIPS